MNGISSYILLITSILTFAVISHLLGRVISEKRLIWVSAEYSPRALKIGRSYKIFSLTVLNILLFIAIVLSVFDIFTTNPF